MEQIKHEGTTRKQRILVQMLHWFIIYFVGSRQPHSFRRGGDYHAMASSQSMLSEGEKREKEGGFWLVDGVEVSVRACFINSCQCQPMHPSSLRDSHVCITADAFLRAWPVWWCWHVLPNVDTEQVVEKGGMALGMMSLQSTHLTPAYMYTTLCAMSHHLSFLLLNCGWNSLPRTTFAQRPQRATTCQHHHPRRVNP